jgi:oxygen-independent coproporphyrinogen-3 oxidase
MGGIYIHIPFCKQACHYCNFHFSTSLKNKSRLIDALVKEISMVESSLSAKELTSIYFGGGTPSLLDEEELTMIFQALSHKYKWNDKIEITLEANPDDIDPVKLRLWKKHGINRLSIGIQSFHDTDLKWMNRAHNAEEAGRCIAMAKDYGFDNLTIDLIYGSPTTTDEMWRENIDRAIKYDIDHISSYCLTVEQGTALAHFVKKEKEKEIDQEKAIRQYDMLIDALEERGYEHYEISNFARNGMYAVHNTHYWKGTPYQGFGPSAHSYDGSHRKWNIANNMKYIRAIEQDSMLFEEEQLTAIDRYNEYVLTRLRTIWGIKIPEVDEGFRQHFKTAIASLISQGYIFNEGDGFLLTRKGKHFADRVSVELMYAE